MKVVKPTKDALIISSVAAGILFSGPALVMASEEASQKDFTKAIEDTQVVRYGHTGYFVSNIQANLADLTLYQGAVDGVYGKLTEKSVKQFQRLHHLKVDGIVGKETLTKLTSIKKPVEEFQYGDIREEVKSFQTKLHALNYYYGQIDGVFGPLTLQAVKEYQQKNNLEETGKLNSPTQIHLLSNRNKKGITLTTKKVKTAHNTELQSSVTSIAKSLLGTKYEWGGNTPSGFDCSGFIKYVFAETNILLPRTVNEIWNYTVDTQKVGIGDLVFFETYKPGPSHVGIYLGNGQFIHTSSSKGVTITSLSNPYWKERYLGAKKVPKA
ncbi:NlpC/P60 family protein [Virgibacillus sp. 6R]|uniref:C40 family peptidase n=1 Tax=Metabacillus sp. 22489 TaxID=3453928 RepID=UPI001642C653